jgi:hypothetical protein
MNVVELNPTLPESLRATLAELPQFDAPASLWLKIAPRQQRTPRWRPWAAAAALAAGVFAVALGGWRGAQPVDAAATSPWASASRTLESELLMARSSAQATPAALSAEAELARLDGVIQAAYDRGADSAELESLWRTRSMVLRTLLASYRNPESVVRI